MTKKEAKHKSTKAIISLLNSHVDETDLNGIMHNIIDDIDEVNYKLKKDCFNLKEFNNIK